CVLVIAKQTATTTDDNTSCVAAATSSFSSRSSALGVGTRSACSGEASELKSVPSSSASMSAAAALSVVGAWTPADPVAVVPCCDCRSEEHTSELQSRENLVC